ISLRHAVNNPTGPNHLRDQERRPKRTRVRDQRPRHRSKIVAKSETRTDSHIAGRSQTWHLQHQLPAAFSHDARNENHAHGEVAGQAFIRTTDYTDKTDRLAREK